MTDLTIKAVQSLSAVSPEAWDNCAVSAAVQGGADTYNPFVSHAFLAALEESGCVGRGTGWQPLHLLVENKAGDLVGAAPCYLKAHSMGEYVFDHAWADAFERAGGRYYPKLQVAVPFTPVTGPRLLVAAGDEANSVREHLIGGLQALRVQTGASSIHATFLQEADSKAFSAAGFLRRVDRQFHWLNDGYRSFDDFLSTLVSRKRKAIKRERRDSLAEGMSIDWVTGNDITEAHWDTFFAFYIDTGSRKWGRPYLNRRFFSLIGERMADRILLVMAKRVGRYVAGAINFIGDRRLYGRHWGCIEEHPFLHFEICYYQAIQFAIQEGLERVEAGAQGEHKLSRGYQPVDTFSAHDIAHSGLRSAVADYLGQEQESRELERHLLESELPYK